jgi:hypothetical protein
MLATAQRTSRTEGENFAERWNSEPARAQAFFEWQAAALADLERLSQSEGLDRLSKSLIESFGQAPASEVLNDLFTGVAGRPASREPVACSACRPRRCFDRACDPGSREHVLSDVNARQGASAFLHDGVGVAKRPNKAPRTSSSLRSARLVA